MRGCLGDGRARWWAVNALEGREDRFAEILLRTADAGGFGVIYSTDDDEGDGGGVSDAPPLPLGAKGDPDGDVQVWVPQKKMKVGG